MTSQIQLQEELYRLGNEAKIMTKTSLKNSEEDRFNESLITLPNSQPDTSIQKGKPKQQVVVLIGVSLDEIWVKGESLITLSKGQQDTSMQKGKSKQHMIVLNGAPLDEKWAKSEQICLVTNHTVTILPNHIHVTLLKHRLHIWYRCTTKYIAKDGKEKLFLLF